ncbi:MAG: nuclear transport factor 2 family protein [Alphaproteobacteria bacterium]|nr:nuclear transport factor 2 family protein [Alphaproteobacteria bacterium]
MSNNMAIAELYYTAMGNKDISVIEKYASDHIQFIGPFAEFQGKQQYLEITGNFIAEIESLNIRTLVGSGDQVTVIYDVHFPDPIGKIRGAALMDFQDGKVAKVELFYDTRPVERKKDDIFSR